MRKATTFLLAVASTCFFGTVTSSRADVPFFMGLGDLPGGATESRAFGISGDGTSVAGFSRSANGIEAFRWRVGTGLLPLGDLVGGAFSSQAIDLSFDGNTVVGTATSSLGGQPYRWTQATGIVPLVEPNGAAILGTAIGTSADGSVVVGNKPGGPGNSQPYRWTGSSGAISLFGPTSFETTATGCSALGEVLSATVRLDNGGNTRAARWTGAMGYELLPGAITPDPTSSAWGISGDGHTIAGATVFNNAAIWRDGSLVLLGDPLGRGGIAFASSFDGSVVGGQLDLNDTGLLTEAFIWNEVDGIRTVRDILNSLGMPLPGWRFSQVRSISDDGLTFVGNGVNPLGFTEAFIVHVPEPGSLAFVIVFAIGFRLEFPTFRGHGVKCGRPNIPRGAEKVSGINK